MSDMLRGGGFSPIVKRMSLALLAELRERGIQPVLLRALGEGGISLLFARINGDSARVAITPGGIVTMRVNQSLMAPSHPIEVDREIVALAVANYLNEGVFLG